VTEDGGIFKGQGTSQTTGWTQGMGGVANQGDATFTAPHLVLKELPRVSLGRNIIDLHTEHKGHLPRHFGMEVVQAKNARSPRQTEESGLVVVEKGDTLLEKWFQERALWDFSQGTPPEPLLGVFCQFQAQQAMEC
jgi:hypothetical protein